jgi:hypothetical protein
VAKIGCRREDEESQSNPEINQEYQAEWIHLHDHELLREQGRQQKD